MQEPLTLAEFPKNLIAPNGKILVADVYGLVGARKRKRSELAVALDNDSVNLYDVRFNADLEEQLLTETDFRFDQQSSSHPILSHPRQSLLVHHAHSGLDHNNMEPLADSHTAPSTTPNQGYIAFQKAIVQLGPEKESCRPLRSTSKIPEAPSSS